MSLASSGVVRLAPSCRVIPASCSALSHAISTRCRTRQRCIPHLTFIRSAPGTALTCRGPVCIPPSVARVRLEVAPLGVASSINPLVSSVRAASAIGRSSLARRSPSPLRPRGARVAKGAVNRPSAGPLRLSAPRPCVLPRGRRAVSIAAAMWHAAGGTRTPTPSPHRCRSPGTPSSRAPARRAEAARGADIVKRCSACTHRATRRWTSGRDDRCEARRDAPASGAYMHAGVSSPRADDLAPRRPRAAPRDERTHGDLEPRAPPTTSSHLETSPAEPFTPRVSPTTSSHAARRRDLELAPRARCWRESPRSPGARSLAPGQISNGRDFC